VVLKSNAIVDPGTVVVKLLNTLVANVAVTAARGSNYFAVEAEPLPNLILVHGLAMRSFNKPLKVNLMVLFNVTRSKTN
jgi:hypothetical protein